MSLLGLGLFLIAVGILLGIFWIKFAWVLVLLGAVAFLWALFTRERGRSTL